MDLLKMLKEAREKRNNLIEKIRNAMTNEELDALELEKRKYDTEIAWLEGLTAGQKEGNGDPAARSAEADGVKIPGIEEKRGEERKFTPLGTYGKKGEEERAEDIYATLEYRNAFKDYIVKGVPIPDSFRTEERAAELTVVGDVAAVIPTTIMNKVIEDLTVEGKILSRITQTSFQGGVEIPISEILPEATWLASENVVSDEQKAKMEAKLKFAYHVLEAKIAVGLLSSTITLPVFEATIVNQLKKCMIRAIEKAVVNGTGSGQPLGFSKYTLPTDQIIDFTDKEIGTVKGWARAEAAIPEAYEENEIYIMNKQTWETHLNSMTSTTGQKIGLGKINEKGQKILNGREVLTVEQFPGFDAAADGNIFGALVNLNEYLLNSNLNMYYKKYFDDDKNKWVHKALMIADGKMAIGETGSEASKKLVGAKGLIYFRKKIVSSSQTTPTN